MHGDAQGCSLVGAFELWFTYTQITIHKQKRSQFSEKGIEILPNFLATDSFFFTTVIQRNACYLSFLTVAIIGNRYMQLAIIEYAM